MKELNEYMDSVTTDVADRMENGWGDLAPKVAEGVKNSPRDGTLAENARRFGKNSAMDKAIDDALRNGVGVIQVGPEGIKHISDMQQAPTPDEDPTGYRWTPGQEHTQPVKRQPRRKRPGVFEREAFNRSQRRKAAAADRREKRKTQGA